MHNNVVRALADCLAEKGLLTLRFNYSGVGNSEGPAIDVAAQVAVFLRTSHMPHEQELWKDVQAATEFVLDACGASVPLFLLGYSFGCALLPYVDGSSPSAYVLVAPTVARHKYQAYALINAPTLVVASRDDFASHAKGLENLRTLLGEKGQLVEGLFDNHFFRGHECTLTTSIYRFLSDLGDNRLCPSDQADSLASTLVKS
jgi:alpha/beta superfamily hydrolase